MSGWGLEAGWGLGLGWGGIGAGADWACELMNERVLVQHPDGPNERKLRDWLCAFSEQAGEYVDVAALAKGYQYDIATSYGEMLDQIGAVVDLPRSGVDDTTYRVYLNIQVSLLLTSRESSPNWTGTINNILRICRQFIGNEPDPIVLHNAPPYAYVITIPGVATLDQMRVLRRFICRAQFAGVLGQVIWVLGDDSIWGSDSVVVPNAGIWGSATVNVPGAATWGTTIPIGYDEC